MSVATTGEALMVVSRMHPYFSKTGSWEVKNFAKSSLMISCSFCHSETWAQDPRTKSVKAE